MNTDHMMTSMTGMFSSALTASPIALATWVPPIFLKLTQETQNERSHKSGSRSHKSGPSRQTESPPPPQAQQLWPTNTMREAAIGGDDFPFDASNFPLSLGAFPLPFACQNICALQRLNSLNTQHTLREHLYLIFVTFYYVGRPHCEAEGGASQPSFLMLSCYLCIVKQCNIQFTTCLIITIL